MSFTNWFTAITSFLMAALFSALNPISSYADDGEEPLVTDRPDITDSSVTVGHLRLQTELGLLWERLRGRQTDFDYLSAPMLVRLGIGSDFEFRLETASLTGVHSTLTCCGSQWKSGFSPIDIGFKYHIKDHANSRFDPSLGAILMVGLPSGTGYFKSDSTSLLFKLAAEFDLAPGFGLGSNIGVHSEKDEFGRRFAALLISMSAGIDVSEKAGVFAEVSYESAGSSEGDSILVLDGGCTWLICSDVQYDIATGSGAWSKGVPDFFLTTGLSVRF